MIYLTSSWENGTNVVNDKFILWREGTEYITAITDMADKIQNILHTPYDNKAAMPRLEISKILPKR